MAKVARLLTLEEVADLLRLPAKSLYTQRTRGVEPGSLGFKVGRHVRFQPADLERWITRQRRAS